MNTLIKIAENTPETHEEQLFTQFMKKVPVWDYPNISKENYLSLSYRDKEKIIMQYYFNIESRSDSEKDRSLKTQLLLSTNSQSPEKIIGEAVWKKQGFFSDKRADFNLLKRNFPENTLCYVNQGYLSLVKVGELAIYNHVFLLGQLTITTNQPNDIETYGCKKNEIKLIKCLYDKTTSDFLSPAERICIHSVMW